MKHIKETAIPANEMNRLFNNVITVVRDQVWTTDNYWLRISIIRQAVLRIIFYFSGKLERAEFARKIRSINVFIESFLTDPDPGRYFATVARDGAAGAPAEDHGKGHMDPPLWWPVNYRPLE